MTNTTTSPPSKAVRLVGYAIYALLIALVLGLALEFYFRSKPDYGRAGFKFDKNLIYRLTPNLVAQKNIAWGKTGEPPFSLRFNKQGFRGPDFVTDKPEGRERILVIGDSYAAGLDYPDDRIFTAQWEQMLNKDDNHYDVLNASCPAWGTDQHYVYWKNEGKDLKPDQVVIAFSPNDIREMWNHNIVRYNEQTKSLDIKKATLPFNQRLGWKWASKSSFYQFLQKKVFHSDHGNFLKIFHTYPVNYGEKDSTDWDMPLFLAEPFEAVENSYVLFEHLITAIQSDCEEIGAELHLVKLPIRLEIDSTYQDSTIFSKSIIEERIGDIARRNNIPFHNFNTRLRQDENPNDIFMDWEYHYDQDGHDWVAKALFDSIKPK